MEALHIKSVEYLLFRCNNLNFYCPCSASKNAPVEPDIYTKLLRYRGTHILMAPLVMFTSLCCVPFGDSCFNQIFGNMA